jgi:hypothetical protein
MLLDDRRIKVREIADTIGISKERVGYILQKELDMKNLCARWVLPLFTADQNRTRMKFLNSAWSSLTKIKLILSIELLLWMRLGFTITHQNSNSSQNSGQKPVVQHQRQGRFNQHERPWHRYFGDAEDILFIDYLEKGKTITGEYYSNLLTRLDKKIHEKRRGLQKKKSSFIRTMHMPKKVFWQWENYRICTINCWNIHPIPQIWLSLTSISSQNSNSSSLVSVFLPIKRHCSCRGVFCRSYEKPL